MLVPINYLFNRIIRERKFGYLVPHLGLTAMILLQPEYGGLPINQTALIATIIFIGLLYKFNYPNQMPDENAE